MFKIAVASGKGGTGKTFVSTNLFYSLVCNNYNAMLVDCDAEAPNSIAFFKTELLQSVRVEQFIPSIDSEKCTWCGKCHEYCNYNAIFYLPHGKIITVLEDICHGCGACSYACRHGAVTEKAVELGTVVAYNYKGHRALIEARTKLGVMSPVEVIKAAIAQVNSDNNFVIFDSPPGTSCPFIHTVSASDYVVLVTEPTPFGLSDLKQSVAALNEIGKPCGVIINRSGMGNSEVYEWLEENRLPLLLEIPFSKEIARVYSEGNLLCETDPSYIDIFKGLVEKIEEELKANIVEK